MTMSSFRRLSLVGLTTVALALPVSAVASTSGVDAPVPSAKAAGLGTFSPSKVKAASAADISKFSFKSAATYNKSGAAVRGTVTYTGAISGVRSEVRVNGKLKGSVEVGPNGFTYPSGWGAGTVVVGPSVITTSDGQQTADSTKSGTFRIRYGVNSGYLSVKRYGSKLTFKAVNVKIFKIHKSVTAGRAILQVKTSSGWKNKKYFSLAANGNSPSYKLKSGKKYWRLKVTTTTTRAGANSKVVHL